MQDKELKKLRAITLEDVIAKQLATNWVIWTAR